MYLINSDDRTTFMDFAHQLQEQGNSHSYDLVLCIPNPSFDSKELQSMFHTSMPCASNAINEIIYSADNRYSTMYYNKLC